MERAGAIKNSSDIQLVMRDCYETTYGIWDHQRDGDLDALSLVAMRETEDSASGGLLYERFRQYIDLSIGKYTHLNLLDFLQMPTDWVTSVMDLCAGRIKADSRTQQGVIDQLQDMAGGGQ
ncbi:hypothetical protein [Paraburkholderia sp. BCC1886]|uniref:hypothetical protein n=1 Tax=Paraburkholderia sp. BCC1886 TaxID=2562670 RepID=UPI001182EDAC|nr:hypothetical protein [Paraburkholderia sp. BCC1886]